MTKNKHYSLKSFIKYIKPYKKEAIGALLLTAFESVLEMFIPFLMNYLLSLGVIFDSATQKYTLDNQNLIIISSLMIICAVLAFTSGFFSAKLIATAGRGFGAELRKATYHKIQEFSFKNIDAFRQSSLITRLTDDNQIIQNAFCICFRPICRAPIQLLFAIIFSIIISVPLSLVLFAAMLLIAFIYVLIIKYSKPKYRAMQNQTDNLNEITKEAITNVKTIKSYVKEDYEIKTFNISNKELQRASIGSYSLTALNMPATNLVVYTTTILILYFGGIFVINDQYGITTVNIAAFLTYLTQALGCFRMINNVFTEINRSEASLERTSEVLETKIDLNFNNDSKLKIMDGKVEFKNVNFKYSSFAPQNTLSNINLKIKKGEFLGIVGQTGSGKSTLVNLIERFYDTTDGEILIDGNNIKQYSEEELHNKVSLNFQSPILFKGTVLDNLKFGNKYATNELIEKACKIACCYEFITNDLDGGFSFNVSEGGTNISGGQRERICIARCLIANPRILIFDDSFSALDHITENKVKEQLEKYLKTTTRIVISQKICTIKDADQIIVMKDGKINNIGTHEELYKIDPIYKDMCISQKEGVK